MREEHRDEKSNKNKQKSTREKNRSKGARGGVKKILLNVEKKMKSEDVKATLGDYMKLLQLQKETTQEAPTQITVMWVDPSDPSSDE